MAFYVSILVKYMINLIVVTLISLMIKKLFKQIKFLHNYCKFPKDSNGSFIFGDLHRAPNYGLWNVNLQEYQSKLLTFNSIKLSIN